MNQSVNEHADGRAGTFTDPPSVQPVPITPHERIEAVDVLRGFAIFGILVVNMLWFAHPFYTEVRAVEQWRGPLDRGAMWLIGLLFTGKFYSLFSFLFGFGMSMQMARATERGVPFGRLYARRLGILFAIGLCHIVLLWAGDILVAYALMGFVLLLFRKRAQRTLIVWAAVFLLLPVVFMAGFAGLQSMAEESAPRAVPTTAPSTAAATSPTTPADQPDFAAWTEQAYEVYKHGSFGEIVLQRLKDYGFLAFIIAFFMFGGIQGMFLLGLYAGRRGVLHDTPAHLEFFRRVAHWGLVIGLPANVAVVILGDFVHPSETSALAVLLVGVGAVGAPALCLFFAATIVLMLQRPEWRARLRPLAAVGRMALTNYLLQSLICTTIFNAYGLGLYGKIGPASGLLLTVGIYAVQIPLSSWWLRRFRFGPAEWLWRSLTYGRRQPMRVAPTS